tara:strand:+ start:1091 stop:1324 length:234 start_codon:yes stop_codon:yes gene_type:complete
MTASTTTTRKRRTRKATTTPRKSASKVTKTTEVAPKVVEKKPEVKVTRTWRELDGFELIILPLLYLEGFVKLILKVN